MAYSLRLELVVLEEHVVDEKSPPFKTGRAEYGGEIRRPTHAWFLGYRGDLAVAVLVERRCAGGAVAAPIAGRFLRALDRYGPKWSIEGSTPSPSAQAS
jgi:hypothetical protein